MISMRRAGCRLPEIDRTARSRGGHSPDLDGAGGPEGRSVDDGSRRTPTIALRPIGVRRTHPRSISISKLWRVTDLAGPDAGVGRGVAGADAKKVVSPQVPLEWLPPSAEGSRARRQGVGPQVEPGRPASVPVRVDLPGPLRIPDRRLRIDLESRHVRAPLGLPEDASLPHGSVPEDFDGRG
jgi:hypothetical protein